MKEFIEKLIGRLEEKIGMFSSSYTDYAEGLTDAYTHAIEIINQLAEEYNNGWIPCSERLPKEDEPVILHDCEGYLELGVARTKDGMKGFECEFEGWWSSANNYLAWQPQPRPYQPQAQWKNQMLNKFDGRKV